MRHGGALLSEKLQHQNFREGDGPLLLYLKFVAHILLILEYQEFLLVVTGWLHAVKQGEEVKRLCILILDHDSQLGFLSLVLGRNLIERANGILNFSMVVEGSSSNPKVGLEVGVGSVSHD